MAVNTIDAVYQSTRYENIIYIRIQYVWVERPKFKVVGAPPLIQKLWPIPDIIHRETKGRSYIQGRSAHNFMFWAVDLYSYLGYYINYYIGHYYIGHSYIECTVIGAAVFPSGGSSSTPNGYLLQYPPCHGGWGTPLGDIANVRIRISRGLIQDRQRVQDHAKAISRTLSTSMPIWSFTCIIFYNWPIASWGLGQNNYCNVGLHSSTPTQVAISCNCEKFYCSRW